MTSVAYITTFNDPSSCASLLPELDKRIIPGYKKFISDQSSPEFSGVYQKMASDHGWGYIHHENGGAQKAKHDIIRHAFKSGFAFMAQISEDFEIMPKWIDSPVPSGSDCFFEIAHELLIARPNITFVNWTMLRPSYIGWQAGYGLSRETARGTLSLITQGTKLCYVSGETALFNWPYTARVSTLYSLLQQADIIGPNSEINLARVSVGHGVTLLAFPVRHTNRERHKDSIR